MTENAVPLFTSKRERCLWLLTLVVLAGIFSTLGPSLQLAQWMRETGLDAFIFMTAMLLVAATIVTHGLRVRPRGVYLAVALGVAAVYLLVALRIVVAAPEERTHLMEYSVVAVLIHEALSERARNGRRVLLPAVTAAAITSSIGVIDECIQALLPHRVFDPVDILFNVLAAVTTIAASVTLSWIRRRIRPTTN